MFIAEREGFEPPVPLSTTVFKTVVIDHSTISPLSDRQALCLKSECKGKGFLCNLQIFPQLFSKKVCFSCFHGDFIRFWMA